MIKPVYSSINNSDETVTGSMSDLFFPGFPDPDNPYHNWSYRNFPEIQVKTGQTLVLEWNSSYTVMYLSAYIFTPEQFISFQSLVDYYQGSSAPWTGMQEEIGINNYEASAHGQTGGIVTYTAKQTGNYIGVLTNYHILWAVSAHVDYFKESIVPYAISATATPTLTSTSPLPSPFGSQNAILFGLDWVQIAILVFMGIVVAVVVVVAFKTLSKKRNTK
jgi:hypothetical protein